MASTRRGFIFFSLLVALLCASKTQAQLSPHFYARGCPRLERIVRGIMETAVQNDPTIPAGLLRLFFHDCFVGGCDASILLEDTATFIGEQSAPPNRAIRGMDLIQSIKSAVEAECSASVSCADILALATRDGVILSGGPNWLVRLGRRDSTTASRDAAISNLPPGSSLLPTLIASFANQGLSLQDLVALSGAHTVGVARCATFRNRIYNDLNIDPDFAATRRATCPPAPAVGEPSPLDLNTPTTFDNTYFVNLLSRRGLLRSDQELFNNGAADSLVSTYAANQAIFFRDFVDAMVKMGEISPLTGSSGEIRQVCSRVN